MKDLDGQPLMPYDRVAIVQRDGSRVKVTIGMIEVLDIGRGVIGVRREKQNGHLVTARWAVEGLKEAKPSECVKIFDQQRRT